MFAWLKRLLSKMDEPEFIAVTEYNTAPIEPVQFVDRGVFSNDVQFILLPSDWKLSNTCYKHDGQGNYRFSSRDKGRTVVIRYQIGERKYKKTVTI